MHVGDATYRHRRARALALMQGAGAALLLVSMVTPGSATSAGTSRALFGALAAVCGVLALFALVRRERVGLVATTVGLLTGDLAIAMITLVANERPGGNADLLLLLWPSLFTAVFLGRRMIALQVAASAGVGLIVFHRAEAGVGVAALQVAVLTVTVGVAAVVVGQLRDRLTAALLESRRLSRTDPLTDLANRRGLDERLPSLWAAATRRGESLVVLLLDIDYFKAVNDRHGHTIGDQVLAQVAAVVRTAVRSEDVVARFGGEELVVVAAQSPGKGHADFAERIRRTVEKESGPIRVTVSIGAVTYEPHDDDDPTTVFGWLLDEADRGMYEAKRAGRNRVTTSIAGPAAAA